MAKAAKKITSEKPVKIKGSFLEVFKVVKDNKEQKALEKKVDELNADKAKKKAAK